MILTIKRPGRETDVPKVPSSRPRRSESSGLPELEIPAVPSTRPKPKDDGDTKSSKGSLEAENPPVPAVPATRPRKAATLDHIKTDSMVEPPPKTPTYQNVLDIYAQSPELTKKGERESVPKNEETDNVGELDGDPKDAQSHEAANETECLEPISSVTAQANETTEETTVDESRNRTSGMAEAVGNNSNETKGELSPEQESPVTKEKSNSTLNGPEPLKNEESTPDEDHQLPKLNVLVSDPASNLNILEPADDSIPKRSSDVSLGISPRSSTESNKPAVPKKPSSKIAAFQQMLAERQQQDMGMFKPKPPLPTKRPSQAADDSEPSDTGSQHARKPLMGFPLPGMAFPGISVPGMPFTKPENDDATDHVADVRKGRVKGPRGRKLPSRVKDSVQVNDETLGNKLNIIVTTSWGIDLRKLVNSDDELQNHPLLPVDEDKDSDSSTTEAQQTGNLEEEQHENILHDEDTEDVNEDRPDLEVDDAGIGTTKESASPSLVEVDLKNDVHDLDLEGLAPTTSKSQETEYSLEKN
ncbi:hypothetical protein KL918_000849 [Ogataea parapolymorpha]|nr:hypothetical protein KL918_000849 [Ogataea parapolymorpha]KAG7875644.1 hypothetical protein KL916_000315 [Ogataea parapolymorpha]